jgi:hypothetical protein
MKRGPKGEASNMDYRRLYEVFVAVLEREPGPKDEVVMRKYRIIFIVGVFASIAVAMICLVPTRHVRPPAFSIGVLSYKPWGRFDSMAIIGITNNGRIPIRCSQIFFDQDGWVQVERQEGWTTRDIGPGALVRLRMDLILPPGSNTTACLALPEGTQRWRVGYKAQSLSLRERVTARLSPNWRARLRLLTDRLSDRETQHEITSAIFECPPNQPALPIPR